MKEKKGLNKFELIVSGGVIIIGGVLIIFGALMMILNALSNFIFNRNVL